MSQDCSEKSVRISRIHGQRRNLLAIAQSEVCPALSGIAGFVNSIAHGKIGAVQTFAGAHVHEFRIRGSYRDRADGLGWLAIKDRDPGTAVVVTLPNSAIHRSDVKDIRLAGHTSNGASAPASKRADHPPAHVHVFRQLLSAN